MKSLKKIGLPFFILLTVFSSSWVEAGKPTKYGVLVGYDQGPVATPLNLQLNKARPVLTEGEAKRNKANREIINNGTEYVSLCRLHGCSDSVIAEIQSQMQAALLGLGLK